MFSIFYSKFFRLPVGCGGIIELISLINILHMTIGSVMMKMCSYLFSQFSPSYTCEKSKIISIYYLQIRK